MTTLLIKNIEILVTMDDQRQELQHTNPVSYTHLGLGLFLALLANLGSKVVSLLISGFQSQAAGQPEPQYALIVGAVCGLLAFLMQSNTNSLFHLPSVAFGVWLISGLGTRQYSLQAAQSTVGQGSLNTLVNSVPAPKPE